MEIYREHTELILQHCDNIDKESDSFDIHTRNEYKDCLNTINEAAVRIN